MLFFPFHCTMWLLICCVYISDFSGICQIYIKYLFIYCEEWTHFWKLEMQAEKIRLLDNSNQAVYLWIAKMVWELCEQRQRCNCTTAVVQEEWWAEGRISHEHPESDEEEVPSSKNTFEGVAANTAPWKWQQGRSEGVTPACTPATLFMSSPCFSENECQYHSRAFLIHAGSPQGLI